MQITPEADWFDALATAYEGFQPEAIDELAEGLALGPHLEKARLHALGRHQAQGLAGRRLCQRRGA
jgi:hypothetical protein